LSSPEHAITVLLADEHKPVRVGVRAVLERDGFRVVAEAKHADEAVKAAVSERPEVCLIDVGMPGGGIAAAEEIVRRVPDTYVVMLSASKEDRDVFDALRAGASGYLLKDMNPNRLPAAVRGVVNGEAALPRTLTAQLIREYRGRNDRRRLPRLRGESLTDRERDVLHLLVDRSSSAKIAERLRISQVTVRRHVSEIVRKLEASDREDAIRIVQDARRES
jgi:DNA-binding NarL/FixJ family response regulator